MLEDRVMTPAEMYKAAAKAGIVRNVYSAVKPISTCNSDLECSL
jgi:hypothetical protein